MFLEVTTVYKLKTYVYTICMHTTDEPPSSGNQHSIFQYFYATLVKKLPIDDCDMKDLLAKHGLMPKYFLNELKVKPTTLDKVSYFLDHIILPSVATGIGSSFDTFLSVMEKYPKNHDIIDCARSIRDCLPKKPLTEDFSTG